MLRIHRFQYFIHKKRGEPKVLASFFMNENDYFNTFCVILKKDKKVNIDVVYIMNKIPFTLNLLR